MSAQNISKNLKYLRKKKGLTQAQVRVILGVTRSTWSNYENGLTTPSIEDLVSFSKFFGITLDDLAQLDLEALDPLPPKPAKNKPPQPVLYPTAEEAITVVAEPDLVYLLQEIKRLQEEVNNIKEARTKP